MVQLTPSLLSRSVFSPSFSLFFSLPTVCSLHASPFLLCVPQKYSYIQFDNFVVPRSALLSRFCSVDAGGGYSLALPAGSKRMLVFLTCAVILTHVLRRSMRDSTTHAPRLALFSASGLPACSPACHLLARCHGPFFIEFYFARRTC